MFHFITQYSQSYLYGRVRCRGGGERRDAFASQAASFQLNVLVGVLLGWSVFRERKNSQEYLFVSPNR